MEGKLEYAENIPLTTNQILPQIPPFRITVFNQCNLGMALPFLDLLFSKNGTFHVFVLLIPDQSMDFIKLREPFHKIISMLPYPLN